MKKVLYLLAALALLVACKQPADPIRDAMEQYAKENIEHPETYKFDYMGIEKEYTYFNALAEYMKGLENLKAQAEDKDPYEEALEQALEISVIAFFTMSAALPCTGELTAIRSAAAFSTLFTLFIPIIGLVRPKIVVMEPVFSAFATVSFIKRSTSEYVLK